MKTKIHRPKNKKINQKQLDKIFSKVKKGDIIVFDKSQFANTIEQMIDKKLIKENCSGGYLYKNI